MKAVANAEIIGGYGLGKYEFAKRVDMAESFGLAWNTLQWLEL